MDIEKKQNGASVGIIIIIIILIIGGIYIWQSKVKSELEEKKNAETSTNITTSDETELDTLNGELDTTDTTVDVDINSLQ